MALVRPLFKGRDNADPICYGPISILPCLSKVLEKLVNKQLTGHLTAHSILSHVQSGFHSGFGCVTATLKVLNDITSALDSKLYCAAFFIDLAKAFHTVDHRILTDRLSSIEIHGLSLSWFANYLFTSHINDTVHSPLTPLSTFTQTIWSCMLLAPSWM